jgi:AcrR family transcriptional regulator
MAKKVKTKWGDRAGRRLDILAAATKILERDGYEAMSTRAVADAADISPGTLYTYFDSKEDLFAVLYAEHLKSLREELAGELAEATSIEDALQSFIWRYLDVYRVYGRELDLWAGRTGAVDTGPAAELADVALAILGDVRNAIERLEPSLVDNPDLDVIVPFIWSSINGVADHLTGARRHVYPGPPEPMVEATALIIVGGVRSFLADRTHAA